MRGAARRMRCSATNSLLAFCLLAVSFDAGAAISFGARTQIWPFMFVEGHSLSADEKMKYEVAVGNLDRYSELGATWNIVDVWQDNDGPDGFSRLDRVVQEHERRGIQVALRLLETPEIYDDIRSGGDSAARALRDYRQWTGQIARKYGARARYYMISNEADHDIGYNRPIYKAFRRVTVDEYREVLRAAYESIHAVDARLRVADCGVSSYSLAVSVMDDLALSGRPGDALAFWRSMDYAEANESERSLARLAGMLASAESRRRIEFTRRSTAELTPYRDVYQLHHYYGPAPIPAVLDWIRARMGKSAASRPIVAGEVGYLIPAKRGTTWDGRPTNIADMARYSEVAHGTSVAETFAALAGNGVSDILYWQMRFHTAYHGPAASLFNDSQSPGDFRTTYPADVFKTVAREMTGAFPVVTTPGLHDGGLVEYRFRRGGDFSVLWAIDGKPFTTPLAFRGRVVQIADAAGRPVSPVGPNGDVGTAPIFVYWQP